MVDAKAANLEIQFHLSTNKRLGGQGLLFVPDGSLLNKANQHNICSFVHVQIEVLGSNGLCLKYSGHFATRLELGATGEIGNFTVGIRVLVPNLLSASFLRELVGGGLCSKGAERSGKVTI